MTTTKTILVLANSIKKHPCRCIAGREIELAGQQTKILNWIRPVSIINHGAISPQESLLDGVRQPRIGEIVTVPVIRPAREAGQPENWLIDTQRLWRSNETEFKFSSLKDIVESPNDLWGEGLIDRSDRISALSIAQNPPQQSLYLIHVPAVTVSFGWTCYDGYYRPVRLANLIYNRRRYSLRITDPEFHRRYQSRMPKAGDLAIQFELTPEHGIYVCVSLAPEFNGYHYKIAATIIEPI